MGRNAFKNDFYFLYNALLKHPFLLTDAEAERYFTQFYQSKADEVYSYDSLINAATVDDLYEYASSPKVGPMAGWAPHSDKERTQEILKAYMEGGDIWAIELRQTGKVIGQLRMSAIVC